MQAFCSEEVDKNPTTSLVGNFHARILSPPVHHSTTSDTSKPGAALTAA